MSPKSTRAGSGAPERFHGRLRDGAVRGCAHAGCAAAGEFRAPRSRTPEREGYDYFCLDHIREFNAKWDYFAGLSREEIEAEQRGLGAPSWVREARPFGATAREAFAHPYGPGQDGPHLDDPIGIFAGQPRFGRFGARDAGPGGLAEKDRQALGVLGLAADAPLPLAAIRKAYKTLVRRYHPDMNGGDRSHEVQLRKVIDAYTHLSSSPAFASPTG